MVLSAVKGYETGWCNRDHHEFISYELETSTDPKLHVIFQIRCKSSKNNEKWNLRKRNLRFITLLFLPPDFHLLAGSTQLLTW